MTNRVIHIFGAAGAGTSTLGRYICDQRGYFFMDTDDYFWEPTNPPFVKTRDRIDRIKLMQKDIEEHENVVISGSLVDWGDVLIPYFTIAIRLETDTSIRIERIEKREKQRFGSRIDCNGDMYENHLDFVEWASSYDSGGLDMRSKAKHDEWQKLLRCKLIELNGNDELSYNYKMLCQYLNNGGSKMSKLHNMKLIEIPAFRAVSSGTNTLDGIFGPESAFSAWVDSHKELFVTHMFEPSDFLWHENQDINTSVWALAIKDEVTEKDTAPYEIINFPGGMFLVATGDENDGKDLEETVGEMFEWINNSKVFVKGGFPESGMCNMPNPQGKLDKAMGISQQQIFLPLQLISEEQ